MWLIENVEMWWKRDKRPITIELRDVAEGLTAIIVLTDICGIVSEDNYSRDCKYGLYVVTPKTRIGMGYKTIEEREVAMRAIAKHI